MVFRELYVKSFGKFNNKKIELADGVNIIYGQNEAGKSTIHSFIKAILFGYDARRSKNDEYVRYEPWENNLFYEGSMVVENDDDTVYRVERKLSKVNRSCEVVNLNNGTTKSIGKNETIDFLKDLNETKFMNTVYIPQGRTESDDKMTAEIKNYVANINTSKNTKVDVKLAIKNLKDKRKQYEKQIQTVRKSSIEGEISKIPELTTRAEELTAEVNELQTMSDNLDKKITYAKENEEKIRLERLEKTKKLERIKYIQEDLQKSEQALEEAQWNLEKSESQLSIYDYNSYEEVSDAVHNVKNLYQEYADCLNIKSDLNKKLANTNREIQELEKEINEEHEEAKQVGNAEIKDPFKLLFNIVLCSTIALCISIYVLKIPVFFSVILAVAIGVGIQYLHFKVLQYREESIRNQKSNLYNPIDNRLDECINAKKEYVRQFNLNEASLEEKTVWLTDALNRVIYVDIIEAIVIDEAVRNLEDIKKTFLKKRDLHTLVEQLTAEVNRKRETLKLEKENSGIEETQGEEEDVYRLIEQRENVSKQITELSIQLEQIANKIADLSELDDEYAEILLSEKAAKIEIDAIDMAIDSITSMSEKIHDNFADELNKRASYIMEAITSGKYSDIKIDYDMNIAINTENKMIPIEQVSKGTIDQLYFSFRIAAADIMCKMRLPLILDDAFVMYDDERVANMLDYLAKTERQVLIFTCHRREYEYASKLKYNFNYIEL